MPLPWPWLGDDDLPLERFEWRNDRLAEPWDVAQEHGRGYNIVVSELLATAPHHHVTEFIIDVHREKTGISQQLFREESVGLAASVDMFKMAQLTRLDLALNMEILSQMMDGDAWAFWNQPYLERALFCLTNLTHFHLHLSSVEDYINFEDLDAVPWMDL
ncbi:uncharacterized protein EI97DRAFT_460897 [Westerdykella ornata]|uniref:Uncharacterized protein n=1 Tax=Westerdykella ornata TaxID=318751 RepID=A0A6A6JEV5_WESOR|nr:uncharacterized protein EI97DRAFT_460897 [Westerdykella ornata]KAF2273709.1 hypothetical protein EI97DRAFT_460897 [Westerdykella ornata]